MSNIDKNLGLFPSTSVREEVNWGEILFQRAENCLNLSEIPYRLKKDTAIEATLLPQRYF